MSDILRLVTRAADGTPTTIRDYENGSTYQKARGSFQISAPSARQIASVDARRYGGARVVGESHDNGVMKWTTLVHGASSDAAISNVETMLGDLLSGVSGRYVEWRPEGATDSVFYEVRGPAAYQSRYEWAEFNGAQLWPVDVQVPVAPLAEGEVVTVTDDTLTFPCILEFDDVPGTAPAKMDLTVFANQATQPMHWGLIAWWPRQAAEVFFAHPGPFGMFDANHFDDSSGFTAEPDPEAESPNGLSLTADNPITGGDEADLRVGVDPSLCETGDFEEWHDVEIFARLRCHATEVGNKVVVSFGGTSTTTYTREFGREGKALPAPGVAAWRWYRLGTLAMPARAGQYGIRLTFSNSVGDAWNAPDVDTVMCVPARQRALLPTGREHPGLAAIAPFYGWAAGASSTWTRQVLSDLSCFGTAAAFVSSPTAAPTFTSPQGGLGGSPLVLPTGDVDVLVCLSSVIPDDPTFIAEDWPLATGAIVATMTARHHVASPG